MSATPASKPSVTKNLFTGMAQLLEAKRDINFDLKTATDVTNLTNDILQMFYDVETSTTNQKLVKGAENGFFLSGVLNMGRKEGLADLGKKNKYFTYFLLSTSGEEFHNMFLKFFHEFDNDRDYAVNQFEFKEMLNFFCKRENIGRDKIEKVFKKLFPINFKSWHKLDKILDRNEDHELGLNLANGVFQQMKCNDKQSIAYMQNKKPIVEYSKLLPLFTAFYSQLISVRINKRKENLEMTRGVDELGDKIKLSESSLCDKFERLGLVYDKDDPVILTYRDIENALILFKNYYTSNFGQQQLDLVLGDVQQKYRYSKKRGDFVKPPLFDQKFLTYLAFKVSIHGICHFIKNNQHRMDQYPIIQEFIYWNIVVHAEKFDKIVLSKKFLNFYKKNPTKPLDQLFSQFIVKVIPLIPRQIGQNILNNYLQACGGMIDITEFADRLYDLLVEQAELKLSNYLEMTFNKIAQQNELLKNENRRQSVLDPNVNIGVIPAQGSQIMDKVNSKVFNVNAPVKDQSVVYAKDQSVIYASQNDIKMNESINHISHKQSVMTSYNIQAERDLARGATEQDRSQIYSSFVELNGRVDSNKTPRIPLLDHLEPRTDSYQFERRSHKEKSITNPNHSQSIILAEEGRATTKEPLKQDYLNSCFIMETFLHNFLYEKTFAANSPNKGKKKETTATKRMSVYGSAKRSSRRMTRISESIDSINQIESFRESPNLGPERNSSGIYRDSYALDGGYQQAQQEVENVRMSRKPRMPTQFRKKQDSFDDLRGEFGDVENFDSDQIFFTKKDMQNKKKRGCACGIEECNVF